MNERSSDRAFRSGPADSTSVLVTPSALPTRGGVETLLFSVFSRSKETTTVVTYDVPRAREFDTDSPLPTVRIPSRGRFPVLLGDANLGKVHPMFYNLRRLAVPTSRVVKATGASPVFVGHLNAGLVAL